MEHGTKWIPIIAMLALIVWYWTPKSMILVFTRSLFLCNLLSLPIFDYLGNHRFKLYVYILNNLFLLIFWNWTPESDGLQGIIGTCILDGIIYVHVIKPLIDCSLKQWQYIEHTIWLFSCWYWTPKSINLQYTRLFLIVSCLFGIDAKLKSDGLMPLVYILNSISAFMLWYWTPEDTNIQWIKLFLLNVCFVRSVADLRNHRLLPSVYIFNFVAALILWYWTPESTIVVWIRPLLVFGFLALFIINLPLGFAYMFIRTLVLDSREHISTALFLFNAPLFWLVTPIS